MADFAEWGFAVAPAIGWSAEDFGRAYWANRNEAFEAVIEDDPVASHIMSLLQGGADKTWQGTTEQLWTKLKFLAGEASRALNFPQSPVALGKSLRRLEPALAARGVTMERGRVSVGSWVSLRATG